MNILFVDDEPNILESYQRQFRKAFSVQTAAGGAEALKIIGKSEPFAVIVSDMQMPRMNGVEFLKRAAAVSPDTVRIMLTGNADQQTAIDALNEGQIFRFLTKPCLPVEMVQSLHAALTQYQLIIAEKELLEKTLIGCVGILVDLLSITDPQLFSRSKNLREWMQEANKAIGYPNLWELEIAALLSQIGTLTLPPDILLKERGQIPLSSIEKELLARVPESGRNLLAKIPRLEKVAEIVHYQSYPYENHRIASDQIPIGACVLKILSDLLDLEATNIPRPMAFRMLHNRKGHYHPLILQALNTQFCPVLFGAEEAESSTEALQSLPENFTRSDEAAYEASKAA